MSTPQDGLANVIADVSFNIVNTNLTVINSFQVGPASAGAAAGAVVGGTLVGIQRVSPGVVDVAIDTGKGAGPVNVGASLQCEFSVAFTGSVIGGTVPMMWTVKETGATTSTPTTRVYRFQFFRSSVAAGSTVDVFDPLQTTITIRRKKEMYPA